MLIVDYYIFKQVLANPRKYLSAEGALQLEKLPNLNNFCNLLENLIFKLCQEELPPSTSLSEKFTTMLWKTKTSQSNSSFALCELKNFLTNNPDFCYVLYHIFRPLEEKVIILQNEINRDILSLKQYIQPLFRFLFDLQSEELSTLTCTFQKERATGFFAYLEKRDQIDALAKNYLKLREMYSTIEVIHSSHPPREFREILDKLQKIPLLSDLLATCDYKILLERYNELILQAENLRSPAMTTMFQEISRYATAFSLKELLRIALGNKHIPISYLSNLLSIGFWLTKNPIYLEHLIKTSSIPDFTLVKQTAMGLITYMDANIDKENIPDKHFEYLVHGPHLQIRLSFPRTVSKPSTPEEITEYILKEYYLKNDPHLNVNANQLYRPSYGFDNISRVVFGFQLLVRFLYLPQVLRDQTLRALDKDELNLLTLALACHAVNIREDFSYINDDAAQAAIFRSEALLLGFAIDQVEPIAWALENKNSPVVPQNIYQWLIHDSIRFNDLEFLFTQVKDKLIETSNAINPVSLTRLNRMIENYKILTIRFMASNHLEMQQSKNYFLATKALMTQIALDIAVNHASTTILTFNKSYLVLGEIDPLLLFDPGPELLKYVLSKLFNEWRNTNSDRTALIDHQKICFDLYSLISSQISVPLNDLANYHRKNSYSPQMTYVLATRYLDNQSVRLTASSEFNKLWGFAAGMIEEFFSFISDLLYNINIPFSYLHNAISIALHLLNTPYIVEYVRAANEDLATFTKTGARLLEQAHKESFSSESPNLELRQLALGAHQQIRYPQFIVFEGKLIGHQSPMEKIAAYIIQKYYLKPYSAQPVAPNGLIRPFHGFDHASRALILFQWIVRLLQEYCPAALCNPDGTPLSNSQLRLVALAVLCHDAANTHEYFKNEAAQAQIFRSEALLLGFRTEEIGPIAWALENKDNKTAPRNIFQWLIHDPDCFEYMRVILNNLNSFRQYELDILELPIFFKPEASSKLDRIITNYKKIITRFMASNRVLLQTSKNSFLATKAFLYQITLDIAASPSSTSVLQFDSSYLALGDIDPLILFDPGTELLKFAENKAFELLVKRQQDDRNGSDYEKLYSKLYSLISRKVSEQCAYLAEFHLENSYDYETLHLIATRYLEDSSANITVVPSFKRLWLHAHEKMDVLFYHLVSLLFSNQEIPLSYVSNAICIALHLFEKPLFNVYMEASGELDLTSFKDFGAQVLKKLSYLSLPENVEIQQLALGQHHQIKYPPVFFDGKIINNLSSISEIAPYILEKYYLLSYPEQTLPFPPLFRAQRGVRPGHIGNKSDRSHR